jgi:hypothetical protein
MNIRHKEITFHPGIHLRLHPLFPSRNVADEVGVLLARSATRPRTGQADRVAGAPPQAYAAATLTHESATSRDPRDGRWLVGRRGGAADHGAPAMGALVGGATGQ